MNWQVFSWIVIALLVGYKIGEAVWKRE